MNTFWSMHRSFSKYLALPIQDFTNKTNINTTLKFLLESQYWEKERIDNYRLQKLKNLVKFAYENVPYYENLFKAKKLTPRDIKQLSDLQKIPILTKDIIAREQENLLARNFDMRYVNVGKTGGTTGSPIVLYKDTQNRTFTWASYYRWYKWMGVTIGDRNASIWGARTVLSKSLKNNILDYFANLVQNRLSINAFGLNDEGLEKVYFRLMNFDPVIFKGYTSSILNIAEYLKKNGLPVFKPKTISTTSETLLPHIRTFLQDTFDAPVYDQYGCGELSAISYECAEHKGLHINQEHIICEILNDKNEPVLNERGRVVGTDLDNYVMPFIRYENGDIASMSSDKCTCGVNQPLMNSIEGRTADTITLKNGSKVHGVFLTDIFYELNVFRSTIRRFQSIQHEPGNVCLLLESDEEIDYTLLTTLKKSMSNFFNDVEIRRTDKIEHESNGKFRYIKILH